MGKGIKRNQKGITKQYLLNMLRFYTNDSDWLNEYEIREHLIKKSPEVFSHKTKLATIRHYHLIPLEKDGKIQSRKTKSGEIQYRKKPAGIEEIETDEDTDTIIFSDP